MAFKGNRSMNDLLPSRRDLMPRRTLLSAEQRSRLFAIPVDPAEMARHYVLSADDLALARTKRRAVNRLGFAVQLCLLRHPGQGLEPGQRPPEAMIAFVARQLGTSPAAFADYALPGSDPQGTRSRIAEAPATSGLQAGRLARLLAGRRGHGVGHGPRRADSFGQCWSICELPTCSSPPRRCWSGSDWPRGPCPQKGVPGSGRRPDRDRAGRTRSPAHAGSGSAPLPLCLAAGLFGVAGAVEHVELLDRLEYVRGLGSARSARRIHPPASPDWWTRARS